ncbi:MAG TPA: calcium/proton exchanger [Chthoniobacterales bacterium]|nr:calcium/proton exchanger [Chthoniobacterales bacterium]
MTPTERRRYNSRSTTTLGSFHLVALVKFRPSLDWLLIFVPIAIALRLLGASPTALFICSAIAIIPAAGWIGRATEALAARVGEGLGGLLNATFGNAAELIIAGIALSKGLIGVVKASITGSIIGNILLVLGLSILLGGTKFKEQRFNRTGARTSTISLSLAAVGLLIPTVFHYAAAATPGGWTPLLEQKLSLAIAFVLFLTYFCVLWFSLRTHKHYFQSAEGEFEEKGEHWSRGKATTVLLVATALVAVLSEFLVGSIESVRASVGITEVFVGVIVVAIVGNAAEHSTAIIMAVKNKMDLSVGIAIGSSLQIALFVAPVLVFLSYAFGRPMDLEFTLPEIFAVAASIYILYQISGDGETNWIEGVQLLSLYLILGVLFFYLPEAHDAGGH